MTSFGGWSGDFRVVFSFRKIVKIYILSKFIGFSEFILNAFSLFWRDD
ncbi:hypothetical protein SAMN05216327_101555 [Dyadobacter sp. SG02]|nr:hypothetical protein SAMN05216327_101555 [Dyadobacter sp. SG02]